MRRAWWKGRTGPLHAGLANEVAALAARLQQLEDVAAIHEVIASYGPAVDSGASVAAAELWTDDGFYDAGIVHFCTAREIGNMVLTPPHQDFLATGVAHISSPPKIEIKGDHASAVSYQQVLFRDGAKDEFRVWRVSACRWDCRRTAEGWKVSGRTNRLLDGSRDAQALFRSIFDGPADGSEDIP